MCLTVMGRWLTRLFVSRYLLLELLFFIDVSYDMGHIMH